MAFGAYNAPFSTTAYLSGSRARYKRLSRYPHITHVPKRLYQRLTLWKLIVCTTGLIYLFAICTVYPPHRGLVSAITKTFNPASARGSITKDQFVAAILRNPVEGLLDPEPIKKLCREAKLQNGLVWHCAPIVGEVGKADNMLLNCVRYAIEAGATTLILPRLTIPSDNPVDPGYDQGSEELSRHFDVSYFLESWKKVCPQIRAVVSDSEVIDLTPAHISPRIDPVEVKPIETRKNLIVDPKGWREAFNQWMAADEIFYNMTTEDPVRVWQNPVFAQWNRELHSPAFANSFPRLFRYPAEIRRLAASALWNLETLLARYIVSNAIVLSKPSALSQVNSLGRNRLVSDGFLGAHLQVVDDAAEDGATDYDTQAQFYISEAKRLNISTIYLATDSEEHRRRFSEDAADKDVDILFKETIFGEEELSDLTRLPADQQALVDYGILLYSSWFYGSVQSSFSWSLALRRGILPEAGTLKAPDEETEDQEWRDSLSVIKGRRKSINPEGLWP